MNKQFLRFTFFLLICLTLPLTATAQVVDIPNPNLRAAVENALGKASGAPITVSDMAKLTHLEVPNANISDLTGLEHATSLTRLGLGGEIVGSKDANSNMISDLSPLVGLTNLTSLDLWGNNVSDISAVAGLTNLTSLYLGINNISDISPIADLTNLINMGLEHNNISDISPVAGLTNLTWLNLGTNSILDVSALVDLRQLTTLHLGDNHILDLSPLAANAGLGSGDKVYVKDNPLNRASIETHIPALQSRGVTVEFDNRPPPPPINTNGIVRAVYFLPSDRPARPDRVVALRQLIKEAQQFFADEMHRHRFGRKTFTLETGADGEPIVHQINGKFDEEYYYKPLTGYKVREELLEHFEGDDLQHVYFIVIDLSYEDLSGGGVGGLGGAIFRPTRRGEVVGGFALIPSHGHNFERLGLTAHELGHAFGIFHDVRKGLHSNYVMAAYTQDRLSKCAAEWLSVSRFFNTKSNFRNEPGEIQFLELQPYSQDTISLHFQVADPDGLHQAQVLVPSIFNDAGWGPDSLFDCKRLNGTTGTVEAVVRTAELADRIALQIIDVGGNITWATFPIQLDKTVPTQNAFDVNSDGIVNLLDLPPIASRFGQSGKDPADVNGDGVVNIIDLLLVASLISSLPPQVVGTFTSSDVQKWLTDAKQLDVENAILQKGIVLLEYLLTEITLLPKLMETTTGQLKAAFGHTDRAWSVAFSPDGGTLASASWDKTIRLWNPNMAQLKTTLIGHMDRVWSVAFSPDGGTLASGGGDKTIRLWDPNTGQLKRTLTDTGDSVISVTFSPDGQTLASGGDNQPIRLWNTTTGRVERTLTGHTYIVETLVFSPDGATLASGSRDKTIRLWNPHTGKHIRTLILESEVRNLAFSPDGATLASASWDRTVRLWNPHTGELKTTLSNQTSWISSVAFSPDGKTLAIGNRGISLWDTDTEQYKMPLAEDIGNATSVVFSPDGQMVASGSADHLVRLWDFNSSDYENFVVEIPDPNLHAAIAESLSKNASEPITAAEIATLTKLEAQNANISDLTGLEHVTSLTRLGLGGEIVGSKDVNSNTISDLSPLAGLTNLTSLDLWGNNVSDISATEGLTNLTSLYLGINNILDISPVADLTNLINLGLEGNNISDISPVAGLTNLTWLNLGTNSILDVSALAGLKQLTTLYLWGNNISDLSPLVANTGLGKGDKVYVRWNPLSYQSIHTHIPTLQSRGVTVEFDNRPHPALLKISGDNQKGPSFTPLSQPFVVEAQDAKGSVLAGVSVMFAVTAGGGALSTTITRTDENGRAQSILTLGPNLGTNTVQVSAAGIEVPATFHAISDTESPPITADVNGDGSVNILDLIVVASDIGNTGANLAVDVNRDGVVSILDLILVAGMFDGAAAAPSAQPQVPETLTAVEVQGWLTNARALEINDSITKRGIIMLEQLLIALTPKETELLANYPNPFNPETWIPYRLAEDAFVTLTIYNGSGQVVRTLDVGHRIASAYERRSKAIHWDGRNNVGERVASGVYFYHLSAGDFSATRKMLILK